MKAQSWLALGLIGIVALSGCGKKSTSTAPVVDTEPTAVLDMHVVSVDTGSVVVGWTSPSDDGNAAASYELRFRGGSGFPWSSMTPVSGVPAPKPPGQAESFRVSALSMGSIYSFAIRSKDASGKESGVSNVAVATTTETTVGADLVVATESDGIWYSLNAGRSWHAASVSNSRSSFGVLAADPQNDQVLYASSAYTSTGDYPALYRSTNGGQSWSPMVTNFLQNGAVTSIAVAPTSSSTIYVGMRGQCLQPYNNCTADAGAAYRSPDGGATWQDISSGLPLLAGFGHVAVYSISVDPTNAMKIAAGMFRNTFDTGFFYSVSGGTAWSYVQANPPDSYVYTVAISPADPERVLVATGSSDALYLSEGGPDTDFTQVSMSGGNTPIVFDPVSPLTVYTAAAKSTNGGQTWGPIMLPAGALPEITGRTHMAVDPATRDVYAAGKSGLYRSTNQGDSWTEVRLFAGCTGLLVLP